MVDYTYEMNDEMTVCYEHYTVQNQTYDKETLKELREKYGIFFLTGKDGCTPIKVVPREGRNPLIVLGNEDDGTIYFEKWVGGQYRKAFDCYFIDGLISDLTVAKKYAEKLKKENKNDQ